MKKWKSPTNREDIPDTFPYSDDVSVLSQPFDFGKKVAPNRICYQPMEGCDGTADGAPDRLTRHRYLSFAEGGAGLIWFEANAVVAEGRANPRQMYLTEKNSDSFSALVNEMKEACVRRNGYEPIIVCQLTHSGRWSKPQGSPAPMIAYNKPIFEAEKPLPETCIVSDDYLDSLTERFVASAMLCQKAGFDGVDIKACHGYLLSELLNAYTRPGKYGGCYENRTRLLFDTISAVRSSCGDGFLIGSRFNAYDGYAYPYGFGDSGTPGVPDFTEAKRLASDLQAKGAVLLNVTMGCPYTNHEINRPTAFAEEEAPYISIVRMLEGAKAVAHAAPDSAVVSSGLSFLGKFAANVAAGAIQRKDFAFAGFGRQTLSYPMLANDILRSQNMRTEHLCLTCGKCTELMRAGSTPGCVIYGDQIYRKLYTEAKK
ncbi:MAG: flavin oxidoreductase/NADH oxidase [Eubacteriales bacterium]